ncbi:MAG TPA: hypothetical protein VF636_05705 [Sphingomonas sp.]|jgi:hypothetical protein
MLTFTPLEKSVLDAICKAEYATLPSLSEVLSNARIMSRDNTGHGFYTEFQTYACATSGALWPSMIDGPSVRMLDMGDNALMGFILWCSESGPTTLEGYQLGDSVGNTIDLRERDLTKLRFRAIE